MRKWFILSICMVASGLGGFFAIPYVTGQSSTPIVAPKDPYSYRDVVQKVLPAVVSIETKSTTVKTSHAATKTRPSDNSQIPEQFRKFFENLPKEFEGQIPETPHHAFGSGVLVDPKGVILTNYHVLRGADEVVVQLQDGRKFTTKDIKSDPKTDLAIVRINAKSALPYLELGDSDSMQIGDRVLAVGAPYGLTGTVTSGIVSAKGRSLHMNMYEDFIQTDAAINPGNSGGPLVNMEGKVIGINTAIKSASGASAGVGMAITSNLVKNIKEQLLTTGTVHRGYLGVQIRPLDPEVASRLGVADQSGVVVSHVFDKTPAAKAGIQAGDIITGIAGTPIKNATDLQRRMAAVVPGKKVEVGIVRDGAAKMFDVAVEEQPREFGSTASSAPETPKSEENPTRLEKLGVELSDMTPALAEQFGFNDKVSGVAVAKVEPNSIAAEAGLQRGMMIVKIDKQPVRSATTAHEMLSKASLEKGILLEVKSAQGGVNYLMLKSGSNS